MASREGREDRRCAGRARGAWCEAGRQELSRSSTWTAPSTPSTIPARTGAGRWATATSTARLVDLPVARLALGRDHRGQRQQPRGQDRLLPGRGGGRRRATWSCRDPRRARSPAPQPAPLGHRPLQPALPVLHAGGGVRLAAARRHPDFEEIGALVDVFADLGVDKVRLTGGEPLLRRDLHRLVRLLAAKPAHPRPGHDHQRRAAGRAGAGAARGGPPPRHGQPRHAARPTASGRSPAATPTRRCSRASRPSAQAGWPGLKIDTVVMRGVNDDELADLIEFGAPASAPRCASSSTWTWAAPRTGRMDQVVSRARDARRASAARYGPIEPIVRGELGARRPLPPARRHGVRHHRVDHRAVLPRLRPQPAHRRRPLVPVPLRARAALDLREPLRAGASREELLALIRVDVAGRAATAGAEERLALPRPAAAHPDRRAQARSAPRDAHARRVRPWTEPGVDVREKGANQQTSDRRLFMQLQALDGCPDAKPLVRRAGAEPDRGRALPRRQRPARRGRCSTFARGPGLLRRPRSARLLARRAVRRAPAPARADHARPHLRLRLRARPRGLAARAARAAPC